MSILYNLIGIKGMGGAVKVNVTKFIFLSDQYLLNQYESEPSLSPPEARVSCPSSHHVQNGSNVAG